MLCQQQLADVVLVRYQPSVILRKQPWNARVILRGCRQVNIKSPRKLQNADKFILTAVLVLILSVRISVEVLLRTRARLALVVAVVIFDARSNTDNRSAA